MRFRYIGSEGVPGSGETFVFDRTVRVGEVFECPPEFVERAKRNRFFEPVGGDKSSDRPSEPPAEPRGAAEMPVAPRRGRPPTKSAF